MSTEPSILCVDDEVNILEGMKANLRKAGKILTATSGAAGLKILEENADIAVVVSDMRMPVMDGYEATECIRQFEHDDGEDNHIPIIALTANAMSSDIQKCIHAGMDGFISKPFSLKDLESAMNRL